MDPPLSSPVTLPPPAVTALKNEASAEDEARRSDPRSTAMERTASNMSSTIKREGQELREVADQSINVVLDLSLDGHVRWASPMWEDIVGIPFEQVKDRPITEILADDSISVFSDALEAMRRNDAKSKVIRFAVKNRTTVSNTEQEQDISESEQQKSSTESEPQPEQGQVDEPVDVFVDLEAQGILVFDRVTGEESHTMWMIKPEVVREVTIDLPYVLVDSLGVGAEMLASHLTRLADGGIQDPENHPPPMPVLCRICERQITPWWFPKHTELCLQEHRAEAELQMAHDTLTEHRGALVKVLDALEAQMRYKSRRGSEVDVPVPPQAEYKGLAIGQPSPQPSSAGSGVNSPSSSRSVSRERSGTTSSHSHQQSRSFTVRRPLSRIIELVLDLCDTALEISTPAIKEVPSTDEYEIRTQSPQSENRIAQVVNWQSPSSVALESEKGLTALCDDTTKYSRAKVDAVLHYRRILEYSERIRSELMTLVQECIEAALQKAARIADGESSGSDSESTGKAEATEDDAELTEPAPECHKTSYSSVFDGQSAMATALRQSRMSRSPSPVSSRQMLHLSGRTSGSSSPRECPTPKTQPCANASTHHQGSISSAAAESDAGAESDGSLKSAPVQPRPRRPSSDYGRVTGRSRERKRTSLHLTRTVSVTRRDSPGRPSASGPVSPLRVTKPRLPSGHGGDPSRSPILSPVLSGNEFQSPTLPPAHMPHHRRQSSAASSEFSKGATLSPRLSMSHNHPPRAVPPSIKDFEIIKPISKGAFGSVYLAKKKSTGDYYAIKALKKADMVAKNQVQNVKAERAILMWQGESDFIAKLYWTFPSKDYIFLVMEYLNGGDCASLVKALGSLPEDWGKRYAAEVIQGVEHLHSREIVHRDLKPDNILIDQKGHLKLTDFGLSRMGLINRQKRALSKVNTPMPDPLQQGPFHRSISIASSRSASFDMQGTLNNNHAGNDSPTATPNMIPVFPSEAGQPSYFNLGRPESAPRQPTRQSSMSQSDGGDVNDLATSFRRFSIFDDPWGAGRGSPREEDEPLEGAPLSQTNSNSKASGTHNAAMPPPPPPMALFDPDDRNRRFVGTPDYLAPETIRGLGQDEMSDWWSMGCILFEFLFGYPPFHAETPDQVFDNILARKIDWPSQDILDEVSPEARDLMDRLMALDPSKRLGANIGDRYESGGEEIRKHPWFADIDWDHLAETEPSFVPAPENIEDTEYFDARGAVTAEFAHEFEDQALSSATPPEYERPHDALARVRTHFNSVKRGLMPLHIPPHVRDGRNRRLSEPTAADDFGQFSFKNLPVLEKANKDVIQKLRAEAMQAQSRSMQAPHSAGPAPSSTSTTHSSTATSGSAAPPTPTLEGSPVLTIPLHRAISTNKGTTRSTSPAARGGIAHSSSPSRASQPSSPLVQFSAGQLHEQRKSSNGSHASHGSQGSSQAGFFDAARLSSALNPPTSSSTSSPVKLGRSATVEQRSSAGVPILASPSSPRNRSQTVGGPESTTSKDVISHHKKRHSQVVEASPSSSETEDARQKALLRVQRRRQSSRRLSQISLTEGPIFRPLDVLVCEDHPVSRLVMEKLLEKLRCRTIIVHNGPEAVRYALSAVKFDIIMMEFKLPQINGADVARMIRETKNANCHTPIVAVTGYLRELQAPHHFDALIEKPPTIAKFTEVLSKLCNWKSPPPGFSGSNVPPLPISNLRKETHPKENSPTSTSSGFTGGVPSSSFPGSSSREDSISSISMYTDPDGRVETPPPLVTKSAPTVLDTDDWTSALARGISGLGISDYSQIGAEGRRAYPMIPSLVHTESSPGYLEHGVSPTSTHEAPNEIPTSNPTPQQPRKIPSAEEIAEKRNKIHGQLDTNAKGGESGDDEDEELGDPAATKTGRHSHHVRSLPSQGGNIRSPVPPSKLGVEMMRSDSRGSVTETSSGDTLRVPAGVSEVTATTPPEVFPPLPGSKVLDFTVTEAEAIPEDGRLTPLSEAYTTGRGQDSLTPPYAGSEDVETPRPLQLGTPSPEFSDGPTPRAEISAASATIVPRNQSESH